MKKRTEKIEAYKTWYETEDGQCFGSEALASNHEYKLKRQKARERIEEHRIVELDGVYPLVTDCTVCEVNEFYWYKINSQREMQDLIDAYSLCDNIADEIKTPSMVCVEVDSYCGDGYFYYLDKIKKDVEDFWKKMGYNIKFENREE
jgi:hypothetical protein